MHPDIINSTSGKKLQLDLYFPSINLAFEYQGEQHYTPSTVFQGSLENRQSRDQLKIEQCKKAGKKISRKFSQK